ncbi:unnamed protein product, partial [Amoebophrya sp. A25]
SSSSLQHPQSQRTAQNREKMSGVVIKSAAGGRIELASDRMLGPQRARQHDLDETMFGHRTKREDYIPGCHEGERGRRHFSVPTDMAGVVQHRLSAAVAREKEEADGLRSPTRRRSSQGRDGRDTTGLPHDEVELYERGGEDRVSYAQDGQEFLRREHGTRRSQSPHYAAEYNEEEEHHAVRLETGTTGTTHAAVLKRQKPIYTTMQLNNLRRNSSSSPPRYYADGRAITKKSGL